MYLNTSNIYWIYIKDKNYYPEVFLEKYNCLIIEKNMSNFNDNI